MADEVEGERRQLTDIVQPRRFRRSRGLAPVVTVIVAAVGAAILLVFGSGDRGHLANADHLGPPAFIDHLTRVGPEALVDWHWPAAPYLIPDIVIYLPIWLVAPHPVIAPAGFLVVQTTLLWVLTVKLSRRLVGTRVHGWGTTLAIVVVVALGSRAVWPLNHLLSSSFHGGTVLWALAGLAVVTPKVTDEGAGGSRWFYPVIALATFSDPLILPAVVAPLGLAVALSRRWRHWTTIGFACSLAGFVSNQLAQTKTPVYGRDLAPSGLGTQVRRLTEMWLDLAWSVQALVLVGILGLAIAVIAPDRFGFRPDRVRFVGVFWAFSVLGTTAALLMTDEFPGPRFQLVMLFLPWLVSVSLLETVKVPVSALATAGLALAGAGTSVLVSVATVTDGQRVEVAGAPAWVECVAEALPDGHPQPVVVASYWEARPLALWSSKQLDVWAVDGRGAPFPLNSARSTYGAPVQAAVLAVGLHYGWDPPAAQFLAPEEAVAKPCGSHLVVEYREPVTFPLLDQVGNSVTFDGCILSTDTGTVDDDCSIESPEGTAGFAAWGATLTLGSGRYQIDAEVSAPPTGSVRSDSQRATLEWVAIHDSLGHIEVLDSAVGDPAGSDLRLIVEVGEHPGGFVGEARVFTSGAQPLSIDGISIRRVDS